MQEFDRVKQLVADAEVEVAKAAGGNKAAGTRLRKAMQEVKRAAQDVRVAVAAKKEPATKEG